MASRTIAANPWTIPKWLFFIPLGIMLGKLPLFPTSGLLLRLFSLTTLPPEVQHHVEHILIVPLGVVLVVLFRRTLGIRILGPFRPMLLAFAFRITGAVVGILFLMLAMGVITWLRPHLKGRRLPYVARVSVVLSTVAALICGLLLVSSWVQVEVLRRVSYLPIVVMCLAAEGFARTLYKEGAPSALWRAAMTVVVALLISLLIRIPGWQPFLLRFPELLLLQVGCILAITKYLDWRLLASLNPAVPTRKSSAKRRTRTAQERICI